jgi:hypothetical protein
VAPKPNFNTAPLGGGDESDGNCYGCGLEIKGRKMVAIGHRFHPDCFKCTTCEQSFKGQPFIQRDGKAYHKACLNTQAVEEAPKCPTCNKAVTGKALLIKDTKYHEECWVCAECKKPFEAGFVRLAEKPYHKDCAKLAMKRDKK